MGEYTFREFLAEQLQDPEFRKEWEASRPEYEAMCADIERRIASEERAKSKNINYVAQVAV